MRNAIIILTTQDLSDYLCPIAPSFWGMIDGYYRDNWDIYIVNCFKDKINYEKREKYVYIEYPIPFPKAVKIRKIGWFFKVLRERRMKYSFFPYVEKILLENQNSETKWLIYALEVWCVSAGKRISHKFHLPLITRFYGTAMCGKTINIINKLRYFPHFNALSTTADMVIMTDDGTKGKEILEKVGNKSPQIFFWKNGVDKVVNSEVAPPIFDTINKDHKILMTLSRLAGWKRVDRAVSAMPQILEKYPKCTLVIVGYGDEEAELRRLVRRLHVEKNVIFAGEIPHDMTFCYIGHADIFLSLYDVSNVGNPLLEAMRVGKPIITLDVGDTSTVISNDKNGILLSVDEINLVPQKVVELLENPAYAEQLGNAAKQYAESYFLTWEERMDMEVREVSKFMEKRNY